MTISMAWRMTKRERIRPISVTGLYSVGCSFEYL